MKTLQNLLIVIIVLTATVAWSQYPQTDQYFNRASKCYLKSLNNENDGVRNNTILMIVQFKKQHPQRDFNPFLKKFRKMSQEDSKYQNRVHAYLASVCLERPTLMEMINPRDFEDSKEFFDNVYELVSMHTLALK